MSYCLSRFRTLRRPSLEVKVGAVGVGGANPIRVQSMTTTDTQDIAATVRESIALAEVGCEIVRITAPNTQAAKCLREIRAGFTAAGFGSVPLVADIHFLPAAAMEAVEHVEKVRINPGNYADKKRFAVREYSDTEYDRELQRLHDAFSPLVKRCRELGRAMRIGTNHGSLSDRIMNRYGDTPLGMVESALEFLRIAESNDFRQIILSMKASNPKVMIEAYRLLAERMPREGMHYPLHLGVTEAGDGEDGRIKGAIGIGSLLLDGLGDTIRVSLTEDSVYEIPVAREMAEKAMSLWQKGEVGPAGMAAEFDSVDPYRFSRRETLPSLLGAAAAIGPEQPPRVIVRVPVGELRNPDSALRNPALSETPAEGLLVSVDSISELETAVSGLAAAAVLFPTAFFVLELSDRLAASDLGPLLAPASNLKSRLVLLRRFGPTQDGALASLAGYVRSHQHALACDLSPEDLAALGPALRALGDERLIFTWSGVERVMPGARSDSAAERAPGAGGSAHALGAYRAIAEELNDIGLRAPLWIRNTAATAVRADNHFLSKLLEASFLTGGLLCDGLGDLVSVETEADPVRAVRLAYNLLQGAGRGFAKPSSSPVPAAAEPSSIFNPPLSESEPRPGTSKA